MNARSALPIAALLGILTACGKDSEHRQWTQDQNIPYQDSIAKQVCATFYATNPNATTWLCPGPNQGPNHDGYHPPGGDGQP